MLGKPLQPGSQSTSKAGAVNEVSKMRITGTKSPSPAMRVYDAGMDSEKLVYVIVADKPLSYPQGRSPIAYIGSTEHGIARMAYSAAYRAQGVLALHGVDSFAVYPFSSKGLPGAKAWWRKLERAFLIAFREEYGTPPKLNIQGKSLRRTNEFDLFSEELVKRTIRNLEPVSRGIDECG